MAIRILKLKKNQSRPLKYTFHLNTYGDIMTTESITETVTRTIDNVKYFVEEFTYIVLIAFN